MEAKEFGRFIAGMRKEKKMTQAELAEKIHVTDKAVSRWERGLGFPDIQTIEPLAQALGISVLELMRSERQEKAVPEIQYTQKEVAEMLQNAGDISRQQKKQDRNANVIAGFLVIGVAAAAWAAKIVNVGGGLILGGLVAAAFVSLWYFFQNLDDEESRKVYGAASILSIGILASLDPIALDQACIDLIRNSDDPGRDHMLERINTRHGTHTIDAAAELGFGTKEYALVNVD